MLSRWLCMYSHSLFEKASSKISVRNTNNFVCVFVVSLLFVFFQVDTGNTGRVLASDAAAFLKKSGLPDLILGKVVFIYYK